MIDGEKKEKAGGRKVRDEVPLPDVLFTHWQNLFPGEKEGPEATLRRWALNGLIAPPVETSSHLLSKDQSPTEKTDLMFRNGQSQVIDPVEWCGLTIDITEHSLVARLEAFPNYRPIEWRWFTPVNSTTIDPHWLEKNPIRVLAATPSWRDEGNSIRNLVHFVCTTIDRRIIDRLKLAIFEGRLQVRGRRANEFGASIIAIPVARFSHEFSLQIAKSRIKFGSGMPVFENVTIAVAAREISETLATKSYADADEQLVIQMHGEMFQSPWPRFGSVAEKFAEQAKGTGSTESKANRLSKRFRSKYPNWRKELSKKRRAQGNS